MSNLKDVAVFLMIAVGSLGLIIGFGGLELVGSTSISVCDIPVLSNFDDECRTDVAQKYDLTTSIRMTGTENGVTLLPGDFQYSTEKSGFGGLSFVSPSEALAIAGGSNVELNFNLVDDSGAVVADGNKYLGEVGFLSQEKAEFEINNLQPGDYTIEYELVYETSFVGGTQRENLVRDIRVPKKIS